MPVKTHEVGGVLVGFIVLLAVVWMLVNADISPSNPCEGYSARSDVRCMGYYSTPPAGRR